MRLRPNPGVYTVLAVALLALTGPAAARTTGIFGYSGKSGGLYCSNAGFGCHAIESGTVAPLVRFEGPTQIEPGAEATYRFVVTTQQPAVQILAGFNVAASAGTLVVVANQQAKLLSGELTHTGPKQNDANGDAAWEFTWRAPETVGEYVLFGAGNSVDDSFTIDGDHGAFTMISVRVGDVPATPTPTPTPLPSGCACDCNGNGAVTINELIAGVNIALGNAVASVCEPADLNGNGSVSINELISAVNKALNGC
ncbi:MAG: choice-of-anchor V domain-containing protein [Candidatus Binatia bacterium]